MRHLWFGPPKNFGLRTAYAYGPPQYLAWPPPSNKILVTSLGDAIYKPRLNKVQPPMSRTVLVVPSPVMSSCAVLVRAMRDAVGCWICLK